MKWIAYSGSIILGSYLAFVALRAPMAPVCQSAAWRLVMPPAGFDPANKQLLAFDEQAPFTRWTAVPPAFASKEQCQEVVNSHMAARLVEHAEGDNSENIRRTFHAFQCVCADDPRFN